jgi:RimJ/RimL family protein N-acetyltransferase
MTTSLLEEEAVVIVRCDEPEGQVVRRIRPMSLSLDNIRKFWDKSKQFPTLFGEEISGDYVKFLNMLVHEGPNGIEINGLFWVVDDFVGMYYMTEIDPGFDANVHYSFFDRRQKGRVKLSQEMLRYAFDKYQFRRFSVEVPLFVSKMTLNFIEEIGFKKEGRKREKALYKSQWFDVACYGLLREELINGR